MVLPRDTGARQQTSELPDFSQVRCLRRLGPGRYMITSLRQRLLEEGRGCFYASELDSDYMFDSYDPTRECFHIDRAVETTDETQDVEPLQQGRTPGRLETTVRSTPLRKKTESCNLRSYESSKRSSTKIASALSCLNRTSSRTSHICLAEVSADGLEKYIDRSSETGSLSSLSAISLERVRTSWRQQCCYAMCPNCRTPKRDAFETRCRFYSKWRQFSRLRAR